MKRILLSLLLSSLFALPCFAQSKSSSHIWETSAWGDIPGLRHVDLFGMNTATTTTFEAAWGESAAYTPLTAAMSTPYCASNSANDAAAGTGARTISVKGINTSFARFDETVTMNGTTSVNLATANVLLIDSLTVLTAGSGLLNAGIIQCGTGANTGGDPAVTHAYMGVSSATAVPAAGAGSGNNSQMFFYGVPVGHRLMCRGIGINTYLAAANGVQAVIDVYSGTTGVFTRYWHAATNTTGGTPGYDPGVEVFPSSSILIGRIASTAAMVAILSAECILVSEAWEDSSQDIF